MERGFHARGVYPRQDISSMGTTWVKQDDEVDTRLIAKTRVRNINERNAGTIRGKGLKKVLTCAKDLTIILLRM